MLQLHLRACHARTDGRAPRRPLGGLLPGLLPPRPGPWAPVGVAFIGDWTLISDPDWLGTCEDLLTELSKGARLVAQAALGVKDLDYFYWCEDGEIRFGWGGDDGFLTETPAELLDTMEEIDRLYPSRPRLYEGPAFLLVEHLTGIRTTEHLLKSSTFRWGALPPTTKP